MPISHRQERVVVVIGLLIVISITKQWGKVGVGFGFGNFMAQHDAIE